MPQFDTPSALRELWGLAKFDRSRLVVLAVLSVVLASVESAWPAAVSSVLHRFAVAAKPLTWPMIGGLVALALVRLFADTTTRARSAELGERAVARMRHRLWRALRAAEAPYIKGKGTGRLVLRFLSDGRAVQRAISNGMVMSVVDLLVIVGCLVTAALSSFALLAPGLWLIGAHIVLFMVVNPLLRDGSWMLRRRRVRMAADLHEGFEDIGQGNPVEEETVLDRSRAVRRAAIRLANVRAKLHGVSTGLIAVADIGVVALVASQVVDKRHAVTGLLLMHIVGRSMRTLVEANQSVQEAVVSLTRYRSSLDRHLASGRVDTPEAGDLAHTTPRPLRVRQPRTE